MISNSFKKVLFLGFRHRPYDMRLYHRQITLLVGKYPNVQCVFVSLEPIEKCPDEEIGRYRVVNLNGFGAEYRRNPEPKNGLISKIDLTHNFNGLPRKLLAAISRFRAGLRNKKKLVHFCMREKPVIVQASDARELSSAIIVKLFTGAKLIYDSHEDYFMQEYEYRAKTISSFLKGMKLRMLEIILLRFFDNVFCTDEFLQGLYRKKIFGAKSVTLLRNFCEPFPNQMAANPPKDNGAIKLVYMGGFNRYRGILECADFVRRYNVQNGSCTVEFHIYSPSCKPIDTLCDKSSFSIYYHGFLPVEKVWKELKKYHVGVCLWQDIQKYRRNIPVKIFEYMAAGLPVLASDFENIRKYIEPMDSGVCIKPDSYSEFCGAIEKFKDTRTWKEFSDNAIYKTNKINVLERELWPYLQIFK